jgi:hypothetical protein
VWGPLGVGIILWVTAPLLSLGLPLSVPLLTVWVPLGCPLLVQSARHMRHTLRQEESRIKLCLLLAGLHTSKPANPLRTLAASSPRPE